MPPGDRPGRQPGGDPGRHRAHARRPRRPRDAARPHVPSGRLLPGLPRRAPRLAAAHGAAARGAAALGRGRPVSGARGRPRRRVFGGKQERYIFFNTLLFFCWYVPCIGYLHGWFMYHV